MSPLEPKRHLVSEDGTIHKYVFTDQSETGTFETGSFFNTRGQTQDVCVSSMAGCMLGCKICATTYAEIPFERLLSPPEMVAQVLAAVRDRPRDIDPKVRLRIGFMGNGEPFLNAENVACAIKDIGVHPDIPRVAQYSISTVGSQPRRAADFAALSAELHVRIWLQYSMFHLDDTKRREVFPPGRPLTESLPFWDAYAETTGLPVFYNIPLIAGLNDGLEHLDQLARFAKEKPLLRHIRLSTFNAFPGVHYQPLPDDKIVESARYLSTLGADCSIFWGDRDPRVVASCGQLRAESFDQSALTSPRSLVRPIALTRAPFHK